MLRLAPVLFALSLAGAAFAQALLSPGTYYCKGFFGRDLQALTLKLYADGRYSNVPATVYGTYQYRDGKVHFIGGHLAGEVGDKLDRDTFRLGVELCGLRHG